MTCREELAQQLRQRGFRLTPQRALILEVIAHGAEHQSAHEVFSKARAQLPGLNVATVYRTLDTMHRAGMLDLFGVGNDLVRFGLHDPLHPHGHLVCHNCGAVLELPSNALRGLRARLADECRFDLDGQHLTLSGLCQSCSAASSER